MKLKVDGGDIEERTLRKGEVCCLMSRRVEYEVRGSCGNPNFITIMKVSGPKDSERKL